MAGRKNQLPVTFTKFLKGAVKDVSEKIGCSQASYVRMCVKKDLDERGYKKTEKS